MNKADMNQDAQENLSAGIDGELSKEELRFLLRRLDHDSSLQQAWARYHIARDSLRRELPSMAGSGFAARVIQAIEQESTPIAARRSHWLRWSAGGAIAASVAAAALMVAQPTGDGERAATSVSRQVAVTSVAAADKPSMPAAVPPWLSGNSAGSLSQQASATLGSAAPLGENQLAYGQLSSYSPMHRYRTLNNNDGSYLLLLDPVPQQAVPDAPRQAATSAQ